VKSKGQSGESREKDRPPLRMFLVPCSCGTTFAVAENYDRQGTAWSRYLICPNCSKRHDPKNRLLQMGYHREGYWQVDEC
jgi:hydrogenase maturation factor HypF (carbamoyltransferase family)